MSFDEVCYCFHVHLCDVGNAKEEIYIGCSCWVDSCLQGGCKEKSAFIVCFFVILAGFLFHNGAHAWIPDSFTRSLRIGNKGNRHNRLFYSLQG